MGYKYYVTKRNIESNRLESMRIQGRGTRGQTLVEYALVVAFISVVAIASLLAMGGQTSNVYGTVNRQLNDATTGGPTSVSRGH